jgi:hypothetical protein
MLIKCSATSLAVFTLLRRDDERRLKPGAPVFAGGAATSLSLSSPSSGVHEM